MAEPSKHNQTTLEISFRRASSSAAIEQVATLASTIWQQHFTPIIGAKQVGYMLEKFQSKHAISDQICYQGYIYFLIDYADQQVGYFAIRPKREQLFLSKLYLLQEMRGYGLGREAIDYLIDLTRRLGKGCLSLTVNRHNSDTIDTYRHLGFIVTGSQVADIGEGYVMDDLLMEYRIAPAQDC